MYEGGLVCAHNAVCFQVLNEITLLHHPRTKTTAIAETEHIYLGCGLFLCLTTYRWTVLAAPFSGNTS